MRTFRVGIDSYCLSPLKLSPFEVLEWAAAHGGVGVQFSEGNHALGGQVDLHAILARLDSAKQPINLSVEDQGGSFTTRLGAEFLLHFPDVPPGEMAQLTEMARVGGERLADGSTLPTDRADWPQLCEDRTAFDLEYLRQLVAHRSGKPTDTEGSI